MQIAQRLNQNNFNEVAKLIENNSIPHDLMKGNLKNQIQKYRSSYSTPASIKLAELHQQAVKYGYKQPLRGRSGEVCGCCNFRIQNQSIAICQTVDFDEKRKKKMQYDNVDYKLRSDVALFLNFIKTLIFYLIFHSLIHAIFNLYTNQFIGNYCQGLSHCSKTIWNTTSMSNKIDRQDLINIVDLLNLIVIVLSIVFFICARRAQYKMMSLIDEQAQTEADYTLLINNIPILEFPKKGEEGAGKKMEFYYRKHLEEYFNKIVSDWLKEKNEWQRRKDNIGIQLLELMNTNNGQLRSDQIVRSISLCYNLSRLEFLRQKKAELIDAYENQREESTSLLMKQGEQPVYSQRFESIPQRVNFLNDCELVLNGQFAKDNSFLFSVTHFVGHAFISFQYQHYKQHIQEMFNRNRYAFHYNGDYLSVQDASHPTDVYWQNLKVSSSQRKKRTMISYGTLAVILIFSFIILLVLELWKDQWSKNQKGQSINLAKSYILTAVIALMILLVNSALSYIVLALTIYQKRKTRSNFTFSLLIKTFLSKSINTIMLYFFISFFFSLRQAEQRFMGPNGLILQMSMLLVVSGFLHVFTNILYPQDLFSRFKRWFRYRKFADKVQNKFQITLNQQYEYPQFNMANRYSYYLVLLYTTLFYAYLIPIGVPVMCVIFFFQYWVDKFNILRRSSLKYHFNFSLTRHINKIYESSILVFATGNLIFSIFMHNYKIGILNLAAFGVSLIYLFLIWLAPKSIQLKIFGNYETCQKATYDDCLSQSKFNSTYWSQNPATFLIEESKVTGKRTAANANNYRLSKEPVFTSVL